MMTHAEIDALGAIVDNAAVEPRRIIQMLVEREAALVVESETTHHRASLAWEAALDDNDGATLTALDDLTLKVAGRLIRQRTTPIEEGAS